MPIGAEVQSYQSFMHAFAAQDLSVNALRTNGLLRKQEWEAFDTAVVEVARQRLNGIADLRAAGLVRDLGGLGVLIDEWESMSDMESASVDMSGVTPDKRRARLPRNRPPIRSPRLGSPRTSGSGSHGPARWPRR